MKDTPDNTPFEVRLTQAQLDLMGFIVKLTAGSSDAEDILQRTNEKLWLQRDRFDASRPFLPWARAIARFEVLTWRKTLSREKLVFSDDLVDQLSETVAAEPPADMTDLSYLEQCCRELPPEHRRLITLFYTNGKKLREIAELLGRPLGTVGSLLAQIRDNLRSCINGKRHREG